MLSGGLADPGLAFELVPVIDRACLVRGARAPGLLRGEDAPCTSERTSVVPCTSDAPLAYHYTSLAVVPLSAFTGEAGSVVAPNT